MFVTVMGSQLCKFKGTAVSREQVTSAGCTQLQELLLPSCQKSGVSCGLTEPQQLRLQKVEVLTRSEMAEFIFKGCGPFCMFNRIHYVMLIVLYLREIYFGVTVYCTELGLNSLLETISWLDSVAQMNAVHF